MSLFKAREWWRVCSGSGEEFDKGGLCVANIDNDPSGKVKVITGSLQGYLRVFLPRERDYKIDDLLLELDLEQAVLQLAAGRFSSTGGLHLAVLHPRKVSVFSFTTTGAAGAGTSFLQTQKLYEHSLEHTAANMTCGPFGGVQGADYICVQSYDGQLSFFEQETISFARFLPNFLIPGPLCYCETADVFITCNASFELECYKYNVLAAASGDKAQGPQTPGLLQAKKVQVEWKLVMGEQALDVCTAKISRNLSDYQCDIIVLGEHSIFCVNLRGEIQLQKRLEYHPACCLAYPVPSPKMLGGPDNLIVVTHSKALLVYREQVLCWAAKTDMQPVAVALGEFANIRGMLVMLEDTGQLVVGYLGTDPPVHQVGMTAEAQDLDYTAMDAEHRRLLAIIRDAPNDVQAAPVESVQLSAQVPSRTDPMRGVGAMDEITGTYNTQNRQVTVMLTAALNGTGRITNLNFVIQAPEPIAAPEAINPVEYLATGQRASVTLPITFVAGSHTLPTSNKAHVLATYTSSSGELQVAALDFALPLALFCQVIPPVKSAEYRITVDTNRPPLTLATIFSDVIELMPLAQRDAITSNTAANVLSFRYDSGPDVTILASKTGGRYRLQSDSFECMWLVLLDLGQRLLQRFDTDDTGMYAQQEVFSIMSVEELPLQDVFDIMDQHFAARKTVLDAEKSLEGKATLFRSLQKRMLVRFKDRAPVPLEHLDMLLDDTYNQLIDLANRIEEQQKEVQRWGRKLEGALQLLLQLAKFKLQLSDEEYETLSSYLTPQVSNDIKIGWEEQTEAAMTQLLRSYLAKSSKESAATIAPLNTASDTVKVQKYVKLVLERISKGQRLVAPKSKKKLSEKRSKKKEAGEG